jgi:hypothetical protein
MTTAPGLRIDPARYPLARGDLVIVHARPVGLKVPADWKIPVAYHLQVLFAEAKDPLERGKRFTVCPLNRYIRNYERARSELVPLAAYGMRIAARGRHPHGLAWLRVERDPNLEPAINETTGKPYVWGNPYCPPDWLPELNHVTSVNEPAFAAIRLEEGMAVEVAA